MGQLGALTQGDRLACLGSSDLQEYDIDNQWGKEALSVFLKFVIGQASIDDKYLPARIREHPDREAEKAKFQTYLRENLVSSSARHID